MRILILNQYFPPDQSATAPIVAEISQAVAQHHNVTVLVGRASYDPPVRQPRVLLRRELRGNLTVETVGSTAFPRHRMVCRICNYITYVALAAIRAIPIKADLVLAMTDPPVIGILAALLAFFRRCKFVYNVRDLHPDFAVACGMIQSSLWVRCWERLHRWALCRADCVIVLGDDMKERIVVKGVAADKVVVIRDGANPQKSPGQRSHPAARKIRGDDRFVVLHAGNIGSYGSWNQLLSAARMLEGYGIGFVFVGGGVAKECVVSLAQGCRSVRFLPFFPRDQLAHVLEAGDLHIVTVRPGLEGMVVPSKLYGLLAAGKAVLNITSTGSDAARIVSDTGCGWLADPEDPGSIVKIVLAAACDPAGLAEKGRLAGQAATRFQRAGEIERYVWLIDHLASCQERFSGIHLEQQIP